MTTRIVYENNLQMVRAAVAEACHRVGRKPDEVKLIGVTKTVTPAALPFLLEAGLTEFGENRWQHAREMLQAPGAEAATWHFIGHLQKNKVKYVVRHFTWVHSVDSLELATELSDQAAAVGRTMQCLVQVNISGEPSKYGLSPADVREAVQNMSQLPGISIRGLMTMAPHTENAEQVRMVFRGLRELRDNVARDVSLETFTELSMGMSEDFSVAIEEGATMIRLGRILMNEH